MSEENPMRHQPSQSRGQKRVEKILHAAGELFARQGYENTTTNAIAKHADTAIGSLYHYFPNKESILTALTEKYHNEFRAMLHETLYPVENHAELLPMFSRFIDSLMNFYLERPGFQVIFYGSQSTGELAAAGEKLGWEVLAHMDAVLAPHVPHLSPQARFLKVTVISTAVKSLLPDALNPDGSRNEALMAEVRRLGEIYLPTILNDDTAG